VGRYPPLYYALVGWPTDVWASSNGFYGVRLLSALWSALFLALALMAIVAWSRSRLLLAGFLLAMTPMTIFLASTVNPNGLETTIATCLWVAGLVLVLERAEAPPPGLIALVTVAGCALAMVRVLSPLWVCLIGLALLGLGRPRQLWHLLRRHRGVQVGLGLVVVCAVAGALWVLVVHANQTLPGLVVPKGITTAHTAALAAGLTGPYLADLVGFFGWTDTGPPLLTMWVWFCGVGFAAVAAAIVAGVRRMVVLAAMVVVVVAAPVVVDVASASSRGFVWQGRYGLPLAVGIPLAGMALVDRSDLLRPGRNRLLVLVAVGVFLGDVAAFVAALRRNTVGIHGPTDPFGGRWHPPLGSVGVTVWFAVAAALAVGWVCLLALAVRRSTEPAPVAAVGDEGADDRGGRAVTGAAPALGAAGA
jgi:hypothetical protein